MWSRWNVSASLPTVEIHTLACHLGYDISKKDWTEADEKYIEVQFGICICIELEKTHAWASGLLKVIRRGVYVDQTYKSSVHQILGTIRFYLELPARILFFERFIKFND